MNFTLTSLLLSNIYKKSPFLSPPINSQSIQSYFKIEKSFFKNFLSSFYYSSSIQFNPKFIASSSQFQRFLSSSLYFDSNYFYSNEIIDSRRLSFILGPVKISFCKFRLCLGGIKNIEGIDTIHNKGGAIFCLTNISLHQCLFEYNSAMRGGSIYCSGELSISSVTFEGGFSEEGQGFVNENCHSMPLTLEYSLFVNLKSTHHTCFSRYTPGNVSLFGNNISTNSAKKINAGFFIKEASKIKVKFAIFFELSSISETSILMSNCLNTTVEKSIFWYIKSSYYSKGGSICLSFYNTHSECTLNDCSFLICSPGNSKYFCTNGDAKIFINGACSTGSENDFYLEKNKNIFLDKKSRFNDQCVDRYVIYISKPFGFHTKDDEIDLATKKSEIYEGFIIGVLGLIIIFIASISSFAFLYQISSLLS